MPRSCGLRMMRLKIGELHFYPYKVFQMLHQFMNSCFMRLGKIGLQYLRMEIRPVSDLIEIDPKIPKELSNELEVSFVPMEGVLESGGISNMEKKNLGEVKKGYTYFADGDVLFAKITPCMENNKGAIAEGLINGVGMGSTEFFVLRPKDSLDKDFIYYLSMSKTFRRRAERWMQGSAGQKTSA